MSTQQTGRDVWADLVGGLLDARVDPASARFDADLTAAVAAGAVTPESAHRLRFWQRASVRALADHARSVLPVALGALEAARREAEVYADEAAAALAAAEPPEPHESPEPPEPAASPANLPEPAASAADLPEPASPDVVTLPDSTRRASTPQPSGPRTLEEPRARLLVADLTIATVRPDRTT
jgi:hypothetical protein